MTDLVGCGVFEIVSNFVILLGPLVVTLLEH